MFKLINNAGKSAQFKRTHCSTLTERVLRIKRIVCSILAEYTGLFESNEYAFLPMLTDGSEKGELEQNNLGCYAFS